MTKKSSRKHTTEHSHCGKSSSKTNHHQYRYYYPSVLDSLLAQQFSNKQDIPLYLVPSCHNWPTNRVPPYSDEIVGIINPLYRTWYRVPNHFPQTFCTTVDKLFTTASPYDKRASWTNRKQIMVYTSTILNHNHHWGTVPPRSSKTQILRCMLLGHRQFFHRPNRALPYENYSR